MENKLNKNNQDYALNDDKYEDLLYSIITNSKVEPNKDVKKSIFEEENKFKSVLDSKVNKLDCLKAEDYTNDDIFLLNSKFERVINKWTNQKNLQRISNQLASANLYECMNKEERSNVSPMCSIENMIESTYSYDKVFKYNICEEICYMRMLAYKWRAISGDGNCFYRSVMYSYLENIIFHNDITMLQRIVVDIDEKFEANYVNTKNLPKENRDVITQLDRRLIITILKIIFDLLDSVSTSTNNKKQVISNALSVLTKAFNFSKSFDIAMVLYLRYKLYEFILENKEKYFSEDFPVMIGNLLPFQYETHDGKFLYEEFFSKELMKLYTYAEKLAIYLTPFVLKYNLRVIFYEFGKECNIQTKDFPCFLKNKETLIILYRKAHYDIAYSKEYCQKYYPLINHFDNFNDKLIVVDENLINYYLMNEIQQVDLGQSKIFNKKDKYKKKEEVSVASDSTSANTTINDIKSSKKIPFTVGISDPEIKILVEAKEKLEKELKELEEKNNSKECKYDSQISADFVEVNNSIEEDKCYLCEKKSTTSNYKLPCGCLLCSKKCVASYADSRFKNFSLNFKESK